VNTDCREKNKIFAVNINTNVHIKLDKAISNRFNKLVIHFLIFFLFVISSQRHIVVSSVNFWCFLAFHNSKSVGDSGYSFFRSDDVVNETTFGSLQRVSEGFLVVGSLLFDVLTTEDDLDSSFSSHNSDLSIRPGIVVISLQVLRRHNIVCTTIGLASDES